MAFHEIQFPTNLSYGMAGGPGFRTDVKPLDSGHEHRVALWSEAKHRWDASYAIRSYADLQTVLEFFHARRGRAHGFRFKDHVDFSTDSTRRGTAAWNDVELGAFGTATDTIQLRTAYSDAAATVYRTIEKPVSGTVKIGWDHDGDGTPTEQSSGWTVDTTTGLVTITDSSANGKTIFGGCQFDVPARFGNLSNEVLAIRQDNFNSGTIPAIPIVEIAGPVVTPDDFPYGGSKSYSADANLALGDGRLCWTAQASGTINLTLPEPNNYYASGAPYFTILHTGSGGSTVVKKHDGTTLATLSNGEGCEAVIVITGGVREFRIWGG